MYIEGENRTQGKILQSHALAPANLQQLHRHNNFWMKNNPSSTLCPTMMGLVSNDFTHRSQLYLSVLQRLMTLKEGKFFWASSTCWAVCWVLESYIQIRSNPCHQGRPIP